MKNFSKLTLVATPVASLFVFAQCTTNEPQNAGSTEQAEACETAKALNIAYVDLD